MSVIVSEEMRKKFNKGKRSSLYMVATWTLSGVKSTIA